MTDDLLGIGLATLAAVLIATQAVCIRRGSRTGSTTNALVVVLLVNVVLLVPGALIVHYPQYSLTLPAIVAFAAAGVVGTLFGRACYYASIERIGASRTEPIKASQPLHATLIAVVLLGEFVTPGHLLGIIAIVVGVAWISRQTIRHQRAASADRSWLWLVFPLGAAFLYGVEPTLATIGLDEGAPLLVGLALKTVAAVLGAAAYLRWQGVSVTLTPLRRGATPWYLLAGIANSTFLLSYYAALDVSRVVVVVPIVQASPLVIALFSWLFLPRLEQVTWQVVAAAMLIVAGAGTVTVYS